MGRVIIVLVTLGQVAGQWGTQLGGWCVRAFGTNLLWCGAGCRLCHPSSRVELNWQGKVSTRRRVI